MKCRKETHHYWTLPVSDTCCGSLTQTLTGQGVRTLIATISIAPGTVLAWIRLKPPDEGKDRIQPRAQTRYLRRQRKVVQVPPLTDSRAELRI